MWLDSITQSLVLNWEKFNIPKLKIICLGGGGYYGHLSTIPGASKVLDSIEILYSQESVQNRFGIVDNFVSQETIQKIRDKIPHDPNYTSIISTSALTTNRERKGKNRCYFGINNGPIQKITFKKFNYLNYFEQRNEEEMVLVTQQLRFATNNQIADLGKNIEKFIIDLQELN
jgi:nicotinamide mononucleotide (NMN) deamidase PncC